MRSGYYLNSQDSFKNTLIGVEQSGRAFFQINGAHGSRWSTSEVWQSSIHRVVIDDGETLSVLSKSQATIDGLVSYGQVAVVWLGQSQN